MKLSAKGVLLGAVADIVTTNVLAIPVFVVLDIRLARSAPGAAPTVAALTHMMQSSHGVYVTLLVLGSLASVFGGWVAGRVARRAEVLNGAASAVACVSLGVYAMIRYPQSAPLWEHIGFLVLSPVLGAIGGILERRRSTRAALPHALDMPHEVAEPDVTADPTPLRGVRRSVYVINRLLMVPIVLMFLLFVMGGLLAYGQHQPEAMLGSVLVCVLLVVAAALLTVGARSLRRGRANHWMFHAGAVAALAFPVAAIALGFAMRH